MTKQEQVDALVAAGKTSKQIAAELGMTAASVRYYRENSKRSNRAENQRKIAEHRRKLKRKAIDYSGGCCRRCSYQRSIAALTFHHIDPTQKEFGLASGGRTVSWLVWKMEVDKCLLLCHNCHAELHDGVWSPDHRMIEGQVAIREAYEDKALVHYAD